MSSKGQNYSPWTLRTGCADCRNASPCCLPSQGCHSHWPCGSRRGAGTSRHRRRKWNIETNLPKVPRVHRCTAHHNYPHHKALLQTRSCHHKLSLQLWVWISRPCSSWRFLHHRFLNIRSIPASHPTHTLLRTAVRCRPCLPPERNNSPRPPDHEGLPPHACGTDAHHRILLSNFPIQTSQRPDSHLHGKGPGHTT